MVAPIRTTTDMVAYIDGTEMAGHASSIEFEAIEYENSEEDRLGIIGTPEVFMKIPVVLVNVTWRSLLPEWALLASNPILAFPLQFRGNITAQDASGVTDFLPTIIEVTGISKSTPSGGSIEKSDGAEYETQWRCTRAVQTINGAPIFDYDLYAYKWAVGGDDLFAPQRGNLGIG